MQAEREADAHAHAARLVHRPGHQRHRQQVGHARHAAQRQQRERAFARAVQALDGRPVGDAWITPDVLVLDGKSVQKDHETFLTALNEYAEIKKIPTLGVGESLPEWTGILNLKGHIKKPLDPSRFHEQVEQLLKI